MSLHRLLTALLLLMLSAGILGGCGITGDEFEETNGAARLIITAVEDEDGVASPWFWSNEITTDGGIDNDPTTEDAGNLDTYPSLGEFPPVSPLTDNPVTLVVKVRNEPRLGVKDPITLSVRNIVFTYRDRRGNARTFAQQYNIPTMMEVAPNATVEITIGQAIPAEMRTGEGGIRDIFLSGYSLDGIYGGILNPAYERWAATLWDVYVDVYAVDTLSGDVILAKGKTSIGFYNPME